MQKNERSTYMGSSGFFSAITRTHAGDQSSASRFDNALKSMSIVGMLLLIVNLLTLRDVIPAGYVIDIYSMLPGRFYLCLILCYIIGTLLLFSHRKNLGILILFLIHLEILAIPFMLGYYSMGRADDMSYIGEYLQISNSGNINTWDIYPASHILGSALSMVTGTPAHIVSFIMPIVFSYLFIAGLILFTNRLFSNYYIFPVSVASSFILYLGPYNFLNVPHALFFAMMPLYLFCLVKYMSDQGNAIRIVFVLFTLLIPFMHPFIVFFALGAIALHSLMGRLNRYFGMGKLSVVNMYIIIVGFCTWFLYQGTLLSRFKISYTQYVNVVTEPVYAQTTEKLTKASMSLSDMFSFVNYYYGRYYIPAVIIFVSAIYVYANRKKIEAALLKPYCYAIVLYLALLIAQIVLLFNPIIAHQPDRITNLNFMVYAQVPLFVFGIYALFLKGRPGIARILAVALVLAAIWGLSLYGCFDSPNVSRPNGALTYNEVAGMQWFYSVKGDTLTGVPISQLYRFHDLFGERKRTDPVRIFPDHFGYTNSTEELGQIALKPGAKMDVVLLTYDELMYQKIPNYQKMDRYDANDFSRFRNDTSVDKVYDDRNIGIYRVTG